MGTPVYCALDYDQYKAFEAQFLNGVGPLETEHRTEDRRFYHKAIRFEVGDIKFEVTGPMVMAPRGQSAMVLEGDCPIHGDRLTEGVCPTCEAANDAARDRAREQREDRQS
jgi:hypothetical protein